MKWRWLTITMLGMLFGAVLSATGDQAGSNLSGHYELADANADRVFSLDVTQTGSGADIAFSAGMANGSGAAPDGSGKGRVNAKGILSFSFKDSFDNEGTGTLEARKDGYHLQLNATKVVEPRCLPFYGDILLRKMGNKPSP